MAFFYIHPYPYLVLTCKRNEFANATCFEGDILPCETI